MVLDRDRVKEAKIKLVMIKHVGTVKYMYLMF